MAPTPDMTPSNGTTVSEDYYKTEDTQYSSMSHAGVIALVVFIILAIFAIFALCYYLYRRRQNRLRARVLSDTESVTHSVAPAWSSFWTVRSADRGDRTTLKTDVLEDGDSDVIALRSSNIPYPPPAYEADRRRSEVRPPALMMTTAGR